MFIQGDVFCQSNFCWSSLLSPVCFEVMVETKMPLLNSSTNDYYRVSFAFESVGSHKSSIYLYLFDSIKYLFVFIWMIVRKAYLYLYLFDSNFCICIWIWFQNAYLNPTLVLSEFVEGDGLSWGRPWMQHILYMQIIHKWGLDATNRLGKNVKVLEHEMLLQWSWSLLMITGHS